MLRRSLKLGPVLLGLMALVVLGYIRRDGGLPPRPQLPTPSPASQVASPPEVLRHCIRVIDGDTIELDGGERVRLIGVDAPESVDPRRPPERFGPEATAFTRRMAEGSPVRLEYDTEIRDQYGRTLAYIYLRDGTLLNGAIIRQGYGYAYTRFPHRRLQEFVGFELEARENGRGLWAK